MTNDLHLYEISNFLLSKQIKISAENEWLLGCCSYYSLNNPEGSIQSLKNFVYEQWLLANLREIGESCLPKNLNQFQKIWLKDQYALQIDSILNVGESCYSQLREITNASTAESEKLDFKEQRWEPKANRVLKLTCTDGEQTVYAMEYRPISVPCEPFIPGLKVLIVGPVESRKGVLLLDSQNIRILGGETDCLIEENAKENVLLKTLNLKISAKPVSQNVLMNDQVDIPNSATFCSNRQNVELNTDDITENDINFRINEDKSYNSIGSCSKFSPLVYSSTDARTNNEFNSRFDNSDDSNSKIGFISNSEIKDEKVPVIGIACPILSSPKKSSSSTSHQNNYISLKNDSHGNNLCQRAAEVSPEDFNTAISDTDFNSDFTLITLRDLLNKQACLNRIYTCQASVEKLITKPRIRNDKWQLTAEISDHSGTLEVSFSNSFLESIFGYSASEVLSQKERLKLNPNVKERIDQILKNGIQRVLAFKGRFFLRRSVNGNVTEVVKIIQKI